ncbi:hypothetical protein [Rhodococcus erythropolis]|uniref:hypothetical protein n=1 Tax=Rhodococcus erythropolis TaxID=1833 RepID=UPI002225F431|nr:hypothetical protein [Rhodococcus erythropolis]MCW2300710.1 hypothetical protein [Rhodococcus erythropolis]
MSDITASIATAIQAKTGGNVEGEIPEWWAEFIDMVLAELQSAGRLIPTGGMTLTAEQVEDVRLIASENYPLDSDPTASINRLRALFPATEPAEAKGGTIINGLIDCQVSYTLTAEEFADLHNMIWEGRGDYSSRDRLRKRFPQNHDCRMPHPQLATLFCTMLKGHEGTHFDSRRDVQWPTAPAEPAEEETKAEGPRKFRKKPVEVEAIHLDNHSTPEQVARWCGGRVATPTVGVGCPIVIEIDTLEGVMTAHPGDWIIKGTQGEFYPCKPAPFADTFEPSSSPVAPAPTETGPWQRIEDVPKSVYLIKDCEGDKWRRDRKSWEVYSERGFRWHPGFPDRFAPFVAAEEG